MLTLVLVLSDSDKSWQESVAMILPKKFGWFVYVFTVLLFFQGWLQDEKVLEEATQKVALLHQKYR